MRACLALATVRIPGAAIASIVAASVTFGLSAGLTSGAIHCR
jgi:hypothetical protein